MDLLEHASVRDVVVLSTVLEEVKKRNSAAYNRLRALCGERASGRPRPRAACVHAFACGP